MQHHYKKTELETKCVYPHQIWKGRKSSLITKKLYRSQSNIEREENSFNYNGVEQSSEIMRLKDLAAFRRPIQHNEHIDNEAQNVRIKFPMGPGTVEDVVLQKQQELQET